MSSRGLAGPPVAASVALAGLRAALDLVGRVEWWQSGSDELAEAIAGCHQSESRWAAAGIAALAEAIDRGLPATDGARSGAEWFRGLVPVTSQTAGARAGLAEAFGAPAQPVEDLRPTQEALSAGDVTPGHAWVVARTDDALAA